MKKYVYYYGVDVLYGYCFNLKDWVSEWGLG